MELDIGNLENKKYKMKSLYNSTIYIKESESGYLSELYYLVLLKKIFRRRKYLEASLSG